jgi:adenylate cyclase
MLLGNIGAEQRFEYRAVGDIVNTASRLQGLNRLLGTRILASGVTLESLSEFLARPLGTFVLRGKTEAVPVYELFAASGRAAPDIRALLDPFAAALELFRAGLWPAAHGAFTSLLERFPADGPSRYYTELCLEYRRRPPADWNGAVSITVK